MAPVTLGSGDRGRGDHKDSLILSDVVHLKDPNIEALIGKLEVIFSDVTLYKQLLRCRGEDAQKLLDFFQWLLDASELAADRDFRRSLIIATQRISRDSNLYPTCYELEGVIQDGQDPVSAGGFADIYKGVFQGRAVCMKTIRMYQATKIEQYLKVFWKEAILWGQLSHPNVLPIYGLYRVRGKICLVSPWMEEGNVSEYLERKLDANRLQLAVDVAQGLSYLHNNAIVHGDLKSPNILINDAGRACLADFGLSSISDSKILKWTSHSSAASKGGSVRWQAPELFDVENDIVVNNSMASDIYAWAFVCYEIFTGDVPFANILRDATIMHQVKSGARPLRPPVPSLSWREWGLTDKIWSIIEVCWAQDPLERPNIDQIIERLMPDMAQDERLRTTENVLSPSNFRRVSKPFNAFTVSALDALLGTTTTSTSSTIPSSSDAPLAQPAPSRSNTAQSVPRTGTQSRPRVRFQVPLPATTVSERPATMAQTARTPAYTLPVTTTSPPPPDVRLIRYPQLMNPHQKTQGYTPSIASMFAPPDALRPRGVRSINPPLSLQGVRGELHKVLLPRECLPRFLKISKANTDANLETCGLLLGKEEKGVGFRVTTLLIPKQHATSDTCTIDKEELVSRFTEERCKITLGWIHTHPSQSCFMTSGDLHTHAKFQRVLPESFAVVCAPQFTPNFGIFRLTDPPGLQTVLGCIAREMYHPHPDLPIYTDADKGHVQMKELQLEIVDLR